MLAIVVAAASLAACATKELQPDSAQLGKGPVTPGTQRDFTVNVGDLVYFSSDSTDLTPEAQQTLQKQAQWLKQYPQFSVMIEGHADERGTREYNIALGARRATTVRNTPPNTGPRPRASAPSPSARRSRWRSATTSPAGRRTGARRRCSTAAPAPDQVPGCQVSGAEALTRIPTRWHFP